MEKNKQKQLITEIMNEDAKDGLYKKQTAVEWLLATLEQNSIIDLDWVDSDKYYTIIEQAKEIEKQQIVEAYRLGHIFHDSNDSDSPEEYYNTEYGKQ